MTWLKDTEPFEPKDTITPKRIAQGLTPATKKAKDRFTHRIRYYTHRNGFQRGRGSKSSRKGNGQKTWGYDRDAFGKPAVQGKSSRVRMRLISEWWKESGV
jgi:hypothetical protein